MSNKKIAIPAETWVELYSELAGWHVQESALDNPTKTDEFGNESLTEEAQEKFVDAVDEVESILESFFEKEEL
tara:strand:- start:980 stop:1198 length:219 start_codon:yes stop_codon:yes gene_type:complete